MAKKRVEITDENLGYLLTDMRTSNGMTVFDAAYASGSINKVFTTNLIYRSPELLKREWYREVDMSKYIAYIIDYLNHDQSISPLLDPVEKINKLLEKARSAE